MCCPGLPEPLRVQLRHHSFQRPIIPPEVPRMLAYVCMVCCAFPIPRFFWYGLRALVYCRMLDSSSNKGLSSRSIQQTVLSIFVHNIFLLRLLGQGMVPLSKLQRRVEQRAMGPGFETAQHSPPSRSCLPQRPVQVLSSHRHDLVARCYHNPPTQSPQSLRSTICTPAVQLFSLSILHVVQRSHQIHCFTRHPSRRTSLPVQSTEAAGFVASMTFASILHSGSVDDCGCCGVQHKSLCILEAWSPTGPFHRPASTKAHFVALATASASRKPPIFLGMVLCFAPASPLAVSSHRCRT